MNPKLNDPSASSTQARRLESLDQFRGFTVLGMLLVNFVGPFAVCPQLLRHSNDYVSYADLIMPQFLFAVGFAMRLSLRRKIFSQGYPAVAVRMTRRLLGLALVSLVIYTVSPRAESWAELQKLGLWNMFREPLKREWFQTLMHIAVTSLWILPVIHAGALHRIGWLMLSIGLHISLSWWFNFHWVYTDPGSIDGGPLGFLTWSVPALIGSFAYDMFFFESREFPAAEPRFSTNRIWKPLIVSGLLMVFGYSLSCGTRFYDAEVSWREYRPNPKLATEPVFPTARQFAKKQIKATGITSYLAEPPFVAPPDATQRKWNYWMMSQQGGTLSYLVFTAGISLALFIVFYVVCDGLGWRFGLFHTFGVNALAAYVLHGWISEAIRPFVPQDSPGWYVLAAAAVFFLINWVFVRHLDKSGLYLKV